MFLYYFVRNSLVDYKDLVDCPFIVGGLADS